MAGANKAEQSEPITIKKYANRRLYNTATSSYVTLDHLCQMVKDGIDFAVYDAKTGEDITRTVLTQIIVEEEAKGENLLPNSIVPRESCSIFPRETFGGNILKILLKSVHLQLWLEIAPENCCKYTSHRYPWDVLQGVRLNLFAGFDIQRPRVP